MGARTKLIWLLCAMSAPVVQLLAGCDLRLLMFTGLACTAVVCLALSKSVQYGRLVSLLQFLWLILAAGNLAPYTAQAWPMGKSCFVVPVVLAALAAWCAAKGPAAAAGTAGILFVLLCIGYGMILGAGVSQIEWQWMRKDTAQVPALAIFLFFIPGAAASIPGKDLGKKTLWLFLIPLFCVAVAVITQGNVHPGVNTGGFPFYEMCRSLRILGFAERFEALTCALISVGWFSLLALLYSAAGEAAQAVLPGKRNAGVWLAFGATMIMILGKMSTNCTMLWIMATLFWGIVPILAQAVALQKKRGKK